MNSKLFGIQSSDNSRDPSERTKILLSEAAQRQGLPRGDDAAGEDMLQNWGVDLSTCRLSLDDAEVEALILGAPSGKAPGPDGLPAAAFKVFARQLTPLFQEAWGDLLDGQTADFLGLRK